MQDGHQDPSAPAPAPSSPTLSPFTRHHPQPPTATGQTEDGPLMRRRSYRRGEPFDSIDPVRIMIQTPNADFGAGSSRIKEGWQVSRRLTVLELKDRIARGDMEGLGRWYRDGMRLIWQGRIVRDDEVIEDIVGTTADSGSVHSFYLVARPIRSQRSSHPSPVRSAAPTVPATEVPQPSTPSGSPNARNTQALLDTIHFLLFLARFHLCHLVGSPPLRWDEMVPPPLYSQDIARQAVMTVVDVHAKAASSREEGWEEWGKAFESVQKVLSVADNSREHMENIVKSLWSGRVGRAWNDGIEGENVVVEIDGQQSQLHLPPLPLMTITQVAHLGLYLRITSLLPLLSAFLEESRTAQALSIRSSNPPANPNLRVIYRRTLRIRLPYVSPQIVRHICMSLLKILCLLWMVTRDMKWTDVRFWVIGGAAFGWWLGDAISNIRRQTVRRPRPAINVEGERMGDNPPMVPPADAGIGAEAEPLRPPVNHDIINQGRARYRVERRVVNPFDYLVPLYHLDVDNIQLRLPANTTDRAPPISRSSNRTGSHVDRSGSNTPSQDPTQISQMEAPPSAQPARWKTQFLLPVLLWFYTLIPEWEANRARAIRKRERAMRILVGELSTAASEDRDEAMLTNENGTGERETASPRVLPDGLQPAARKYYERVMERGEGIDWEEEREAQRALEIGEEERQDAGGEMGFRML